MSTPRITGRLEAIYPDLACVTLRLSDGIYVEGECSLALVAAACLLPGDEFEVVLTPVPFPCTDPAVQSYTTSLRRLAPRQISPAQVEAILAECADLGLSNPQ